MSSPAVGVYVVGDAIRRKGRGGHPRAGETFHAVTDPTARALLDTDELADLRWDGATVVRRDQADIDARIRADTIAGDDSHFENDRIKALLLVLLDEINVLRTAAGLPPRTVQQAQTAYTTKLNR